MSSFYNITNDNFNNKEVDLHCGNIYLTDGNYYINNVPIGAQGDTGPQGPTGEQGIQGTSSGQILYLNAGELSNYGMSNLSTVINASTQITFTSTGNNNVFKNVNSSGFITLSNYPNTNILNGGIFQFAVHLSMSSSGGSPSFYPILYKVSQSGTITQIASGAISPTLITEGTLQTLYSDNLAVPTTQLLSTDRLAVKFYGSNLVNRTATMSFQDNLVGTLLTTIQTSAPFMQLSSTINSSYTLVLTDAEKFLVCGNTGAIDILIPTDASVNFGNGTEVSICRFGTGSVRIKPSNSGITTVHSNQGYQYIQNQYTASTIKKLGTNSWILLGPLSIS